jgi:hypothetical protein
MGNLCPCCPGDDSHKYTEIPDEDKDFTDVGMKNSEPPTVKTSEPSPMSSTNQSLHNSSNANLSTQSTELASAFRTFPDAQETEKEYDLNSAVFKGMVVQQKFFNKSSYDPKFVWINLATRSLCLSEHNIKERRHKEANIADIVGVMAVAPEKYKAPVNSNGETIPLNPDLCLSIKFVRGGGIDLQFQTREERDVWYSVIARLTLQEKELRKHASQGNVMKPQ